MHIHLHACCQHADGRTNGCNHRQSQMWTNCIYRIFHAHWHLRQRVEIEQIVLCQRFVQSVGFGLIAVRIHQSLLSDGKQHVLQSLWHLSAFLAQGRVYASQLFRLRKTIVTGNDVVQELTVETANMTKVHRKLKGQRVAIVLHRFASIIIHSPPLADYFLIGNTEIRK